MKQKNDHGMFAAVRMAAASHRLLTVGTVLCVAASVAASLLPPLLLARVIDRLTAGLPLSFLAVLLYFSSLALEGVLTSAQESLLVLFGQRMTHALRSEMSRKLSRLPPVHWQSRTPARWPPAFRAMWTRWKPCLLPASSAWQQMPAASSPSWGSLR